MTPSRLLHTAIIPAAAELVSADITASLEAHRFLLAIALQESALKHRRQVSSTGEEDGPASSFWQFEKGGGCKGVLQHRKTSPIMRVICGAYNVEPTAQGLWEAMRYQDIVAACAARLLVYSLPSALPSTAAAGWDQYLAAWRPGKPHKDTWAGHWATASNTVGIAP